MHPPFTIPLLFARIAASHAVRHPVVTVLNILGIALGVGVYLAIQTANSSADAAFRASIDTVAGRSHLEVRDVPDSLLPTVVGHPLVEAATPIVEVYATLPDFPGRHLRILGIDVFSSAPFQIGAPGISTGGSIAGFLSTPRVISLSQGAAGALGAGSGGTLDAHVNARSVPLSVAAVVGGDLGTDTSENLAFMDIGWAQELAGMQGKLSSIQVRLRDPTRAAEAIAALRDALPPGAKVAAPEQRGTQIQTMLEGFQLNLRALSMVSVLVGAFLIYNTVSASVVRRRKEIGTLRSLGATRAQIATLFLAEAALLGILGTAVGVPLGLIGASALVAEIAKTISVHYVLVSISELAVTPSSILLAITYGIAASLIGAWMPAREAAHANPIRALQPGQLYETAQLRTFPLFLVGCAAFLGAAALAGFALFTGPAWLSFLACLALVAAFSLAAPQASMALSRVLAGTRALLPVRSVALVSIALDNFTRSLSRSTATVAALMAALAMVVGVTVMITSFRNTVDRWLGKTMVADLFVGPAANAILGQKAELPASLKPFLEALDGVDSVDSYRDERVRLPDGNDYALGIIDAPDRGNLTFASGDASGYLDTGGILINEALARRLDLNAGQALSIAGKEFTISGIFFDYADDHGTVYVRRQDSPLAPASPQSLAVYLEPGTSPEAIADEIRGTYSNGGELVVLSNRSLRERVFDIFDQTFAVTGILRTIAVLVAVVGIVLSLTILVVERAREIAMFRAVGGSPAQVFFTYLTEAGLVGLVSGLLGTACGICLAVVLTWVVNKAFFGWTVQFEIPHAEVLLAPLWVTAVAIMAGVFPAARAARAALSPALRSE